MLIMRKNMRTVGELMHSLSKARVLAELSTLYNGSGEDPAGYDQMWDTLKSLQPKLTKLSVVLSRRWSLDEPPEPWVDISGVEAGDPQHLAIEYVDWGEWLSMPVHVAPEIQPMSPEEQLAHCLYEMSWAGYTQAVIKEQYDEILDMAEEVKILIGDRPMH